MKARGAVAVVDVDVVAAVSGDGSEHADVDGGGEEDGSVEMAVLAGAVVVILAGNMLVEFPVAVDLAAGTCLVGAVRVDMGHVGARGGIILDGGLGAGRAVAALAGGISDGSVVGGG